MAAIRPLGFTKVPNGFLLHKDDGTRPFYNDFQHRPLSAPRMIRLIKLNSKRHPSSWAPGANLNHFAIVEKSIDEPGLEYVAMSYTWGSPEFTAPLTVGDEVGGSILPVTPSAWEAANLLAPSLVKPPKHNVVNPLAPSLYTEKFFWVDQICINQKDEDEKAEQVKLMREIYSRCRCCAIWLGPADEDIEAGFAFLRRLDVEIPSTESLHINLRELMPLSHSRVREILQEKYKRDRLPPVTDPGWAAFARCLCKSWFSRLWTFQETVLPQKDRVVVCSGRRNIVLKTFQRAAYFLGREYTFGVDFGNSRSALDHISKWQWRVQERLVAPLILLLQNTEIYECTDPRDKIYALLGVQSEDLPMAPIMVDYKQPVHELYIDVSKKMIAARSSLQVCTYAPERQGGQVHNLPSWIPDWTAKALTVPFEFLDLNSLYFRASTNRIHRDTVQRPAGQLWAKGEIVDAVVEAIDSDMPEPSTDAVRKDYLVHDLIPYLFVLLESRSKGGTKKLICTPSSKLSRLTALLGKSMWESSAWEMMHGRKPRVQKCWAMSLISQIQNIVRREPSIAIDGWML